MYVCIKESGAERILDFTLSFVRKMNNTIRLVGGTDSGLELRLNLLTPRNGF